MLTSSLPRYLLAHVLAWSVFIVYEVSILFFASGPQRALWWEYIGYYALNIALFYANAHLVFAFASGAKKSFYLLLLLIPLELSLYLLLEYGLVHFYALFHVSETPVLFDRKFVLGYIWRGIYFIGLSTTYWFVGRTLQHIKRINQLKRQRLEAQKAKALLEVDLVRAQNAYLQAQINPHLLFNSLNFIYSHVQEVSPKASEGLILLSDVMRYALTKLHDDGKTELSREVAHIENYIKLNQLRFRYPLQLHTHFQAQPLPGRIPPLLLLTFVENIFKHGDLTDPVYPSSITIGCRENWLDFYARNKKRKSASLTGHGIGVRNAKARLQALYRESDYMFDVQEDAICYAVTLQLKLV
jgi:sensor histidine kinase YesM